MTPVLVGFITFWVGFLAGLLVYDLNRKDTDD